MRSLKSLVIFSAFISPILSTAVVVDQKDDAGVVIIDADADASIPSLTEDEQELVDTKETMQVDPRTGVRLYRGYKLIRTTPKTQEHLDVLRFISNGVEDFWTPIPANLSAVMQQQQDGNDLHVDLLLGPKHLQQVLSYLECQGVPHETSIDDVQQAIDEENVPGEDEDEDGLIGRHDLSSHHSLSKRQINLGSIIRTFFGFDSTHPRDLGNHPTKIRQGRHFNPAPAPEPLPQPPPPPPSNQPSQTDPTISLIGKGRCGDKSGMNWREYQPLNVMNRFVSCLASEHIDKMTIETIGSSYEGRDMQVMKIGVQRPNAACPNNNAQRPAIWIDGGIHAREWISPATVMYLAHELLENYDEHRDIVDCADIFILPVVNPDGYDYTWRKDRMWRKTRSRNRNSNCVGADPNRNWSHKWGGEGASSNACTEIYMGSRPFSESETRAVANFVMRHRNRIRLFLTFHSYGQYLLYPWGWTDAGYPPNYRDLHSLAKVMDNAMKAKYTIGSAAGVLYPAAGGSDDWAKGEAGIEYSYTVELPDEGRYGFLLPARRIRKTVKDTHSGVMAMIRELIHNRRK